MSSPRPLRGEIWEFDLDPKIGREQKGTRPCLVVSTNAMNASAFGTVVVCPITTRDRPSFAWRPGMDPEDLQIIDDGWTARSHWVATDQIVTLDTARRALRHLATVTNPAKLERVDGSLRSMLSLDG